MLGKRWLLGTLALILCSCGQGAFNTMAERMRSVTLETQASPVFAPPEEAAAAHSRIPPLAPTDPPAPWNGISPTAYPTPTPGPFPADFQLTLVATPAEGKPPLHVMLTARLTGGRDESYELSCVGETWDLGNGESMGRSGSCVQWTPFTRVRRTYTAEYTYQQAGAYQVRLQLGRGDYHLDSNVVTVVVH